MSGLAYALVIVLVLVGAVLVFRRLRTPASPCGRCPSGLPVCDPVSGRCVACTPGDATYCPHGQPYCTTSNLCARCVGDSTGCPAGTFCLRGDTCVACRSSADCPRGRVCRPDGSGCVECLSGGDCADPSRPYCDPASGACVGCLPSPTDTCGGGSPDAPHCEYPPGTCVRCLRDADCGPGGYCVAGAGGRPACVACVAGDPARACPAGQYCAGDPPLCVQCVEGDPARACPAGQTCAGGRCVRGCASSADCGSDSSTPNCIGGVCVKCAADAECARAYPGLLPYCNGGLCVECLRGPSGQQEGCPNPATPVCVESVCEQCGRDTDCAGNPAGPFCQKVATSKGTLYECVACTSDAYCAQRSPATPYCRPADYTCVACDPAHPCPGGQVCGANGRCVACDAAHPCPGGMWCSDPAGGQCIQCRSEADCAGRTATPHCDTDSGRCVACRSAGDCAAPTPACLPDGSACVRCASGADCRTQPYVHCSTAPDTLHTCVECDSVGDCTDPDDKYCDAHQCLQCRADADCSGGYCLGAVCRTCPAVPPLPASGAPCYIQNAAAGPGFWLALIVRFEASCGGALLIGAHDTSAQRGMPPGPAPASITWLAAEQFVPTVIKGKLYLANNTYFQVGGPSTWYVARDTSYPYSGVYEGLLAVRGPTAGVPYDPTADPDAAWLYAGGVLSDPGRTLMLQANPAPPADFMSGCGFTRALLPSTPYLPQLVAYDKTGCQSPANRWLFAPIARAGGRRAAGRFSSPVRRARSGRAQLPAGRRSRI